MINHLPEYFARLREAFTAHERVDLFDLHSEDATSRAEWRKLCLEADAAQVNLLTFVQRNGPTIAYQLGRLRPDDITENDNADG